MESHEFQSREDEIARCSLNASPSPFRPQRPACDGAVHPLEAGIGVQEVRFRPRALVRSFRIRREKGTGYFSRNLFLSLLPQRWAALFMTSSAH